jgi:hypothetical protein
MLENCRITVFPGLTIFVLGLAAGSIIQMAGVAEAQTTDRVFELRTYTTNPGRLDALHARFSQHTITLFERHGMTNIGYFSPQDAPLAENTLIYLLAHDSRQAADASWAAFGEDPDWQRVYTESIRDGRLVKEIERIFLDATHFSQLR